MPWSPKSPNTSSKSGGCDLMKRFICIMPAPLAQRANDWLALTFGEPARQTFTVGLNPTGDPTRPITHRVCNWQVSDTEYLLLAAEFGKAKYSGAVFVEGSPFLDDDGKVTGREFVVANGLSKIRLGQ